MATTAAEKQRRLEDAWDATQQTKLNLRDQLRQLESAQGKAIAGGSLASVSANGRHSQFSSYGPGQSTPQQVAECYRELINLFDQSAKWLRYCAVRNVDAFNAELLGVTQVVTTNPAVIIDDTGKWLELCQMFSVDSASIIGQPVSDDAVFLWMMDHTYAVHEARSDYQSLRTGSGAGWV